MRLLLVIPVLLFFSCQKKSETAICTEAESPATIHWTGSVPADGCDWVIQIGSIQYSPESLPESFQVDGLPVKLCYVNLKQRFSCGMMSGALPMLRIVRIER